MKKARYFDTDNIDNFVRNFRKYDLIIMLMIMIIE